MKKQIVILLSMIMLVILPNSISAQSKTPDAEYFTMENYY